MSLTVASVVRNEADRFLSRAISSWQQFSDRIVVLDDGSTDETPEILDSFGVEWRSRPPHDADDYGDGEWAVRAELWEWTQDADWVIHLDADQTLSSDPRPHLREPRVAFRVFDLWSADTYRSDAWWQGHSRCWWPAVHVPSVPADFEPKWPRRQWHSANFPPNLPGKIHSTPLECSVLHYAYASPELRAKKAEMYADLAPHLTAKEQFHAKTILTPDPQVKTLPFTPEWSLM